MERTSIWPEGWDMPDAGIKPLKVAIDCSCPKLGPPPWPIDPRCPVHGSVTATYVAYTCGCEQINGKLRMRPECATHMKLARDKHGFAETRAQLDELAQVAEGSHRQHMGKCDG